MDARGTRFLRQPDDVTLHLFSHHHHEVAELVDKEDDMWHTAGDMPAFLLFDGTDAAVYFIPP